MPLASIHLFSLSDSETVPSLIKYVKSSNVHPLVAAKPIRWIIRPEHIQVSDLLTPRWDLLLILEENKSSKDFIASIVDPSPYGASGAFKVVAHWTATAGIPSRLTKDFAKTNPNFLHPKPSDIPALTGTLSDPLLNETSQDLSLSPELLKWIGNSSDTLPVRGAVSMLNLLSFKPDMKESYLKYGKAFSETIGAKRGGNAKLVGNLVSGEERVSEKEEGVWHEFALAHYPSLLHFADMLGSRDYQEVNQKFRVPALGDTCILFTSELEVEDLMKEDKAKL